MIERNIVPDEVIYLKDDTENGDYLLKRWYHTNKEGMWRGKTGQQTNLAYSYKKVAWYLIVQYSSFAKSVQCQADNCLAQYAIICRANFETFSKDISFLLTYGQKYFIWTIYFGRR